MLGATPGLASYAAEARVEVRRRKAKQEGAMAPLWAEIPFGDYRGVEVTPQPPYKGAKVSLFNH